MADIEKKIPECADVATKVIKIYAVSEALTKGWDRLPSGVRDEHLGKLEKRVDDLLEHKQASKESAQEVKDNLLALEKLNESQKQGDDTEGYAAHVLLPSVVNLAVQAIGSCVCGDEKKTGSLPTRYDVNITIWEERDRLHIGIVDKATEQISYADWWDEDARQMFEDGFFKSGKGLENSVLEYAEEMGILAK